MVRKKSGLGVDAFFEDGSETREENGPPETGNGKRGRKPILQKREKIRKTYVVYRDTQLAIELMKFEASKSGKSVSLSDILEEAIETLMEKKGLKLFR